MPSCPPADFDKKSTHQSIVISFGEQSLYAEYPKASVIDSYDYLMPLDFDTEMVVIPKTIVNVIKPEFNFNTNYNLLLKNAVYYNTLEQFLNALDNNSVSVFGNKYDLNFIKSNTTSLIQELFTIGVDYVNFEFTLDESILLTSKLSGKKVYCELYFDIEDQINQIEVLTNIYDNKNQIFTGVSDIQGTIEAIFDISKDFIKILDDQEEGFVLLPEASGSFGEIQDYRNIEYAFG